MKKWLIPLLAVPMALSFSACGSSTPSTPASTQSTAEIKRDLTWDNNNTDPYNGWAALYRDSDGGVSVFLRCSPHRTGTYITYGRNAVSMNTVVNSPDCPAK